MSDNNSKINETEENNGEKKSAELTTRRDFLRSLGKWSAVIIGSVTGATLIAPPAAGWVNGGGGWINGRGGGGGGSWVNRNVGGGSWVNRSGGWVNGGGGSWINSRGGWINRR